MLGIVSLIAGRTKEMFDEALRAVSTRAVYSYLHLKFRLLRKCLAVTPNTVTRAAKGT